MLDYISKNILRHPQVSFSLQVTEGKQDLEKALSLSQKFQKESAALQEWLTTNEAQLQQKNGCEDMPADIDAEIAWANVSKRPNLQKQQRNVSTSGQWVEQKDSMMFLKTPISLSL